MLWALLRAKKVLRPRLWFLCLVLSKKDYDARYETVKRPKRPEMRRPDYTFSISMLVSLVNFMLCENDAEPEKHREGPC
jgi:hypothetical protein